MAKQQKALPDPLLSLKPLNKITSTSDAKQPHLIGRASLAAVISSSLEIAVALNGFTPYVATLA